MKIGIIAVHGVIPQIRFGFQDEVATHLATALNDQKNGHRWRMSVVLPANGAAGAADVPTISRVHRIDDNPENPRFAVFDVHEAFWSPLDKGRTNLLSVLSWLLATIFAPFNNFARFREVWWKVCWDIGYTISAIGLAIWLLLLAAMHAANLLRYLLCKLTSDAASLKGFVACPGADPPTLDASLFQTLASLVKPSTWRIIFDWDNLFAMLSYLLSPMTLMKTLQPGIVVGLVCGLVGSYLAWQACRSAWFLTKSIFKGHHDPTSIISRIVAIAIVSVISFAFLHAEWTTTVVDKGVKLSSVGLLVVIAVALFDFGRGYLTWFVVNFFGDVQIYTTRNQNSAYYELREAILEKVESVILRVVTKAPAGAPYDRVYVLAHSLGSTIAMDALMRLYDLVSAPLPEPQAVISVAEWHRIRAFVTFGTSLEKTKYFFNAWSATPSQEWEQWNSVAYGGVFSARREALAAPTGASGIYWHNNWFVSDFVSDEITTYRSILSPGDTIGKAAKVRDDLKQSANADEALQGRTVAHNRSSFGPWPRHLETHTWYLEDKWFWHPKDRNDFAVIDVLTACIGDLSPKAPHARPVLSSLLNHPSDEPRFKVASGR